MQQYAATPQAIFIAFDASNIVSAEEREQRNTLIILFALATVLLASVLSFFWYRRYLRSRQLLQDEMKRKDCLLYTSVSTGRTWRATGGVLPIA